MVINELNENEIKTIRDLSGYLNFSSGTSEPRFFKAWNDLFFLLAKTTKEGVWSEARSFLDLAFVQLGQLDPAFRENSRATRVLSIVYDNFIPAWRLFHADLLHHQSDELLYNPFFLAKACALALVNEESWPDLQATVDKMIKQINDFLGYRPIPVLEGREKHEPNPHEWITPLPLYIKGVGIAWGRYYELVEKTLEILRTTDPEILHSASFDPDKLDELVLDPRAYDFDHPVNRRPNYNFGTWDPHTIDMNGYYRRFVVHQVTVDGILLRTNHNIISQLDFNTIPHRDLVYEGASVLAGTMLMGSGVTGDRVQAHDSSVTLATLMPPIAEYRDRFYDFLIRNIPDSMKPRLNFEAKKLFQPFAGARQDLNRHLAKTRADQLQRFHLARTYARMGYFEAAERQSSIIAVASARFFCQIDCRITAAHLKADDNALQEAYSLLPEIEDLLQRGIACGALPDPWSMLGFSAEFSLFPSVENTVHDHRIDDLIGLMNDIFDLYSRLQKEAAAAGLSDLQADLSDHMSDLAGWWDQFGSTEVSNVEGFSGAAVWESAAKVSTALAAWHHAGTAAGDVAFWCRHVERFNSPKAFVLLGDALLDKKDQVAAMALLVHWLSHSDSIPLIEGDYSFHSLTFRWMESLWQERDALTADEPHSASSPSGSASSSTSDRQSDPAALLKKWDLATKFIDFLEANADKYWNVPVLEIGPRHMSSDSERPSFRAVKNQKNPQSQQLPAVGHHFLSSLRAEIGTAEAELLLQQLGSRFSHLDLRLNLVAYFWFQEQDREETLIACDYFRSLVDLPLQNPQLFVFDSESELEKKHELFYNAMKQIFSVPNESDPEIFDAISKVIAPHDETPSSHHVSPESSDREFPFNDADESSLQDKYHQILEKLRHPDDYPGPEDDTNEKARPLDQEEEDDDDDPDHRGIDPLFRSAYENMTFHDSADDGISDEMMESPGGNYRDGDDFELSQETDRINDRLAFIFTMVKLWKFSAVKSLVVPFDETSAKETRLRLENWLTQAIRYQEDLSVLLYQTSRYVVPAPRGTTESLIEYDQHQGTKEILLDKIIWSMVEVNDTILYLESVLYENDHPDGRKGHSMWSHIRKVMSAIFRSDVKRVRKLWHSMLRALEKETLLYIPTSRGGDPIAIVKCRCLQQIVLRLLEYTPKLGLLTETFELLRTVQIMEQVRQTLPGVITEFDRIFETATHGVAQCVADSSKSWRIRSDDPKFKSVDDALVIYIEKTIDALLSCWLSHSRHIRISTVESLMTEPYWDNVKQFIINYGEDLLTQQFLGFRNMRAILHQGADTFLKSLVEMHKNGRELEVGNKLVQDIVANKIDLTRVASMLDLIFECVAENYTEYVDYNSTTTHSDHGSKLYMFLDMLRVLTGYERVAWNLKPVYWVHDTMIRAKRSQAAALWEQSVARKSSNIAEENIRNYNHLSARYGIWIPSIHERLQERFIRPLQIDRMCAVVPQAIRDVRKPGPSLSFQLLEDQIAKFAETPMGVGYEIPEWLETLQEEVMNSQAAAKGEERDKQNDAFNPVPPFEQIRLSRAELERQIRFCVSHLNYQE
ncbi:MAG: hypothetical protein Q4G68_06585 [Planctomycetia bacterium]|nr:hypothetical protein [Planctomycetia bacterium]